MVLRAVDLAHEALADIKTARAFLNPQKRRRMKPATRERLKRAAERLGWREDVREAA